MATTEILPFATNPGADVMDQADYAALAAVGVGYSTGVARSEQLNKTWRQSSFMAAGLANWIASKDIDVPDDGDLAALVAEIDDALSALFADLSAELVTGPASATANAIVLYNGTTGKLVKDSAAGLSTDGTMAANSDALIPTQKAVRTFTAGRLLDGAALYNGATDSIVSSFNLASVTKNATGDYTFTWSTPFANAEYFVTAMAGPNDGVALPHNFATWSIVRQLAGSLRLSFGTDNSASGGYDWPRISVMAFGT